MTGEHEAQFIFRGRGERRVVAAYKALSGEAARTMAGTSVSLSLRDGALFLSFKADSVPALRALMNSYLRWLAMVDRVLDVVESEGP